jgi:hypothetical protein
MWDEKGDTERAQLERRNVEIERMAAQLERDRADLEISRAAAKPQATSPPHASPER